MSKKLLSWAFLGILMILWNGVCLLKADETPNDALSVNTESATAQASTSSNEVLSYTAFRSCLACPWRGGCCAYYQRPMVVECAPQTSPRVCGTSVCWMRMPVYADKEVVYNVCVPQVEARQKVVTVMVPRRRWREERYSTSSPRTNCYGIQPSAGPVFPVAQGTSIPARVNPNYLDSDYLPPPKTIAKKSKAPQVILPFNATRRGLCSRRNQMQGCYPMNSASYGREHRRSFNPMPNFSAVPGPVYSQPVPAAPAPAPCLACGQTESAASATDVRRVPFTVMVPEKRLQTYYVMKMVPMFQKEAVKACQCSCEACDQQDVADAPAAE